ncbi:stalk domain-containing protein [Anoxynatronum sibiricum]|uniref:Stalk domain-containing protein n=1 Tax=Anoxynatronum sibiricum TaxID=210623 RepID=A0ABU9VWH4_9CLOT
MKQQKRIAWIMMLAMIMSLITPMAALANGQEPPLWQDPQLGQGPGAGSQLPPPMPPPPPPPTSDSGSSGSDSQPPPSGSTPATPPTPSHSFDMGDGAITIRPGTAPCMGMIAVEQDTVTSHVYAVDTIRISGSGNNQIVADGVTANITLRDVNININIHMSSANPAFKLKNNATVTLTLEGNNTLRGGEGGAGVQVPTGSTLTIGGNGTITVAGGDGDDYGSGNGGAGIHGSGTINLTGGVITAMGGGGGDAIGMPNNGGAGIDGQGGAINLTGGVVTATGGSTVRDWSTAGVGIRGNVTIGGGTVTATGGSTTRNLSFAGMGIQGNVTISGGTVTATGGSTTGNESRAADGVRGTVDITGGAVTATGGDTTGDSSISGSGICGDITMNGGAVTATAGNTTGNSSDAEAGIYGRVAVTSGILIATGGSTTGNSSAAGIGILESVATIISGGTVTAVGGDTQGSSSQAGAGISGVAIQLTGGSITATGGSAQDINSLDGFGIRNQASFNNGHIVIENHPSLVATGGGNAAPVGVRPGGSGTLILRDGSGNDLTYLRMEMKQGSTPLANAPLSIFSTADPIGIAGTTNEDGVVGFFVPRTPATDHTLSMNQGKTSAVIQPGDRLTRSYSLNMANEAVLTGLALTTAEATPAPVPLTPAFQGNQRHYTAQVNHHQTSLHLYPTAPAAATITLHHAAGTGTSPFQHIPLQEGTNDFRIVNQITDNDAEVIYLETYTLSVHRGAPLSGNAALGTLNLSKGTLTPAFAKDHYQYTATVAHAIDTLILQATTEDTQATLAGTGTKNLKVGSNPFEVTVTAENGSQKIYHITIIRSSAPTGGSSGGSSGGSGRNNDRGSTGTTPPAGNQPPAAATNTGDTPLGETQGTDGITGQRPPVTIRLAIGQGESQVNGTPTPLEAAPYIDPVSHRTMMPLRFISEALGATVTWKAEAQQVIITSGDTEIILTIGSTEALVNGLPLTLETSPVIQPPGRTFVPLRFISEALGVKVTWHPETQAITLTR